MTEMHSGKIISILVLSVIAALLTLSLYVHFTVGFWSDKDWELLVAGMLLDGKKLYIDHFPVNPPLIFYLYTLPVALSLHTSLQDYQALTLLSLFLTALVITLSTRLIAWHPAFMNGKKICQLVILLCFLFIFRIAPAYFGDREHLFLLLTFPYLLRWMPSLSNAPLPTRLRVLIGFLAAIGFCMKPHCLILLAGIAVICLLRKDRPKILSSIENRIIYAIGILYLLFIALVTPEYFSTIVPMALLTYSAISAGATGFDFTIALTVILTFAMFRPRHTSPYRSDIYYFMSVSVFLLAYGMANNGWGYTYQPLLTLLLFVNGFVFWEFLYLKETYAARNLPVWTFVCGAALCLFNYISKAAIVLLYCFHVLTQSCHGDAKCPGFYTPFVQEINAAPAPHSFGTIGMNFPLWSRVSKLSGAAWETRFSQLWMIPKFIISSPDFADRHQWILYYVAGALAEDLEQKKPETVFVDASSTIYTIRLQKPFDWVSAFSAYLNFKQAWQHYSYVHTIDSCATLDPATEASLAVKPVPADRSDCRYDVYRRQ